MKNLLIIPALFTVVILFAQIKSNVPEAVKTAFAKAFPGATKLKYEKEDGNFEVSFSQNSKEMSAIYDSEGVLLETEEAIKPGQLPPSVLPYFNAHYKGVVIKETAKIVNNKGVTTYEIGTKGKDILFDATGKFIKEAKD